MSWAAKSSEMEGYIRYNSLLICRRKQQTRKCVLQHDSIYAECRQTPDRPLAPSNWPLTSVLWPNYCVYYTNTSHSRVLCILLLSISNYHTALFKRKDPNSFRLTWKVPVFTSGWVIKIVFHALTREIYV